MTDSTKRLMLGVGVLVVAAVAYLLTREPPDSITVEASPDDLPGAPGDALPPAHGESRGANLAIILIDTLRADRMSAYGYPAETSPELDALAADGVRFGRVVSQCSWTRPSIASLLTSRSPRTLGIYVEKGQLLADRFDTLAEVLARNGYTSIAATANPNTNSAYNFQQGYDQYLDSTVRFDWMDEEIGGRKERDDAPLQGAREVFTALLRRAGGLDEPPFHLMATIMDVHEAADKRVDLSGQAELFEGQKDRRYLQAIAKVSKDIAWFRQQLLSLPGWEHTVFVIVSDHGQGLSSHPDVAGGLWHGWLAYESQVVVPLILHSTQDDLPRGFVVEQPVRLLDVMPTLLDLLGIDAPPDIEGESLRPLMGQGESAPALPEHFVVESRMHGKHSIGVFGERWNYFEHRVKLRGTDPKELQPVGIDENGSKTNRIDAHREVAARYEQVLDAWERAHPAAAPTMRAEPISDEMKAQLKSLGYAGE